MKLARGLQSAFRTSIAPNKQRQHPVSYTTRNSIFPPSKTTQPQSSLIQPSLPLSRLFTSSHSPNSSSRPASSPTMDTAENKTENTNGTQPESQSSPLPALPAADGATSTLEVGGAALRLDHLGPLVVNEDGTLSRIANWEKMAEIERENTLRILGKRNQMRLAKLRAAAEAGNSETATEKVIENK